MSAHENGEHAVAEEKHPNTITEPMIQIGRDETGQVRCHLYGGMHPGMASALLEHVRVGLLQSFTFNKPQIVQPARIVPPVGGRVQ